MKFSHKLSFFFILLVPFLGQAQYYETHHIAPSPWQYWSQANEVVISTIDTNPVTVTLKKSDGTLITTLTVLESTPQSYRFSGSPASLTRNLLNQVYDDRGLVIEASAPVLVNYRNIASDVAGATTTTIKGNASLLSFGEEGEGLEFRVGYYRSNFNGLSNGTSTTGGQPVYSVMAIENATTVNLPTGPITLNQGQSYLFNAPIGTLITANKKVVMVAGSYGDTPQACGGSGQDGTVDQLAPVSSLGDKYMVVRGAGAVGTGNTHPEQTVVIATQSNTTFTIENFSNTRASLGIPTTITLVNAGDFHNFHHGNTTTQYSSSMIIANKPISVISGTAFGCETDFSTVLPIGGCTGATDIRTRKFINYNNIDLNFFSYIIIESATEPVFLNGNNIETLTGNNRIQIGNTTFYLITFNNFNIGSLGLNGNILLNSNLPLTVSIVQQEENISSMSAFFSSFGEAAIAPLISVTNLDCSVTLEATEGMLEYEWFLNGISIGITTVNTKTVSESGDYTVKVKKNCGWTRVSKATTIEVQPCNDLSITKVVETEDGLQATFKIVVTNNNPYYDDPNVVVSDLLPSGYSFVSYVATQGNYNSNTGNWNVGLLQALQSAELTITVDVNSDGNYKNIATVSGQNPDPDLNNNSDFAEIEKKFADLDATKTDGVSYYQAGQELNYVITVVNKGPAVAYDVKVSDPMPLGVSNMTWSSSINTNGTGDLLDVIPQLNVGNTVVYNVKLKVPKSHLGDFVNIVEISSDHTIDPVEECTGCIDIDRQEIYIPKGISPNGDNINDFLDLEYYHVAKISIFNRYGSTVYSKTDYKNEWHGQTNNGKLLPTGTYFYVIHIIDGTQFTGYIQLVNEGK